MVSHQHAVCTHITQTEALQAVAPEVCHSVAACHRIAKQHTQVWSVACAVVYLQEGAAAEALSDVRYKLLNLGLLTAGVGHCIVLQVRAVCCPTAAAAATGTWCDSPRNMVSSVAAAPMAASASFLAACSTSLAHDTSIYMWFTG